MKKLTHSLRDRLLEFIRSPGYRPQKDHHLADTMGLDVKDRSSLRAILRDLSHEGHVEKLKGNRWGVPRAQADRHSGALSVSPSGHGIVRLAGRTGAEAEVFIPPGSMGGALHGDEVVVEILPVQPSHRRAGPPRDREGSFFRPEGRIVSVTTRRKTVLVGILMQSPLYWYVIPDHPRVQQNIHISGNRRGLETKPEPGQKVVVRIHEELHGEMLSGEITEILGFPDQPGVDVLSILREHEIATGFSDATEHEARNTRKQPDASDLAGRLDLRSELILTIDPADARDHDDAVSLRHDGENGWILGVHIADVSHFVTPGSAIDRDAREHGNSVYMVDRFIPMLPPYLTSEVCSLKAGRDRLAYSVFIAYDRQLGIRSIEMHPSVIHPRLLLDYEHVQRIIKGEATGDELPPEVVAALKDMHHLATLLRDRRFHNGAIDLSMPEVSCKLDESGRPVSIKRRMSVEAYHLIEEFMLAANIAVAERLLESNVPGIYRIHEDPSEDQWVQMSSDLQQLGVNAHPESRFDVQRILSRYTGQPMAYPVSLAVLRNFKRAIYSAECSPHFGLAFERYTHFTSPIRRYSDLVVHRILKSLDAGRGGFYSKSDCEAMAEHCSRREREASEAEEESLTIKRIQYYEALAQKGEVGPWPALITGGTARGLFVEVVDTLQKGFIPTYALPDPTIKHDRQTGFLTGRKGRVFARIGDVVQTELVRIDRGRRVIELRWIEGVGNHSGTSTPSSHAKSDRYGKHKHKGKGKGKVRQRRK